MAKSVKLKILWAAALLALPLVGPARAQSHWTQPFPPFRVIGNLYYVGSAGLSAWLISTPKGLILLDVGVPANAEMVERNIEALGFQVRDIKVLLNSHAHFDHSGGLAKLKEDSGAKLYASVGDRFALEKGVYPGWEDDKRFKFPPVAVDRVLKDGDTVDLGGVVMTARMTPGHTAGCTSYLLNVTENSVQHTAFFFCSASIAANRLAPNPQYPGIISDYRKTFSVLKTVHADVYLAPHPEFYDLAGKRARLSDKGPNPFVEPDELKAAAAKFEADFDAGLAKQQADAAGPQP